MHLVFDGMWGLVLVAVLGMLAGGYCALAANTYADVLTVGGEPNAECLHKALLQAFVLPDSWSSTWATIAAACSVLMAICFVVLKLVHGWSPLFMASAIAATTLLLLALIDARTRLLPDALTLPLMWAGLALAWSGHGIVLHDAVAGAMLGYGFLWSLFWAFKCLSGREGMGYGDFKLLAALGAWLGWYPLAMVLLASCVGSVVFAMLHQRTLFPGGGYPFGPFLAAAGAAALMLGPR